MPIVGELLKGNEIICVQESSTVHEAAKIMDQNKIGAIIVLHDSQLVGIFSERDILNRVVARSLDPKSTKLNAVMTTNLVVINAEDSLEDALSRMKQIGARHLPVVKEESLVGIISIRDLLYAEIERKDEELKKLSGSV